MLLPLRTDHAPACVAIVATLPEWFGYEGALEGVERAVRDGTGYVVEELGEALGFIVLAQPFEETTEILYLAVRADRRRGGLGRTLLIAARDEAVRRGASSLCLLTLGPSAASPAYAETVGFYRHLGLRRVKELRLSEWGGAPALVMQAPLDAIG